MFLSLWNTTSAPWKFIINEKRHQRHSIYLSAILDTFWKLSFLLRRWTVQLQMFTKSSMNKGRRVSVDGSCYLAVLRTKVRDFIEQLQRWADCFGCKMVPHTTVQGRQGNFLWKNWRCMLLAVTLIFSGLHIAQTSTLWTSNSQVQCKERSMRKTSWCKHDPGNCVEFFWENYSTEVSQSSQRMSWSTQYFAWKSASVAFFTFFKKHFNTFLY